MPAPLSLKTSMPKAFDIALRLLTRRDHSAFELRQKLKLKGCEVNDIEEALAECQRLGYQSDQRFVESYCRYRMNQGFGPLKIMQELKAKGVSADLIQRTVYESDVDWLSLAALVWKKKTKECEPESLLERQKYQRFMLQRGFSAEVIHKVNQLV